MPAVEQRIFIEKADRRVGIADINCYEHSNHRSSGVWQVVEKYPSAALRSPFFIAAYGKYVSFLPASRAVHSDIFEQPEKD